MLVFKPGAEGYGISSGRRSTPWRGCIWWYCAGMEVADACGFVFMVATPGLFCSVT